MTVTINTLGTNSRQLVISGETSATNIIDGINTALVALGWTLIDTVTSGSRGCLTTKVYSAPNNDGVSPTTKYMIIRYDLPRQYWWVSCCESWNTSTNVATNESWYGGRQILLPLQYSNCTLYVFATARYACFMGVVLGEPGPWQGVFEFERAASGDTAAAGVPCFAWTSSLTIGEPYGNTSINPSSAGLSTSNGFTPVGLAAPRVQGGATGLAAAVTFTLLTNIGSYPPGKNQVGADWSSGGITQYNNSHTAMLGAYGAGQAYVWDASKTLISNLTLAGYTSSYVLGKLYGLKTTVTLGPVLDTTTVPVDANLFYSAGGTNTTHYLMGIHGNYCDRLAAGSNRMTATATTSGTALGGNMYMSVVVGGRYVYITSSTGIHKFDAQTQGFTYNILPAASYYTMKFDGGNNLYVLATSTLYKINLSDDTNTSLALGSTSWIGLAVDDDYLYVFNNGATASTTVKRVTLSTFTETTGYTVTTGSASNYVTHMSTADYGGYLYVGTLGVMFTGASNNRITRVTVADATQITLTPSANQANANSAGGQVLTWDGNYLWFFTNNSNATLSASNLLLNKVRISDFTFNLSANCNDSSVAGSTTMFGSTLAGLSLEVIPYAGIWLIARSGGAGGQFWRIIASDPKTFATNGNTYGGSLAVWPGLCPLLDSTYGAAGLPCTDGCSYYVTASATTVVRYTGTFRNYNFNGVQSANLLIAQ